jgi:hypothetical protein
LDKVAKKDGNINRPSLLHAADGLSPFLVLDLDEDEVAQINDDSDVLMQASNITMADIRRLKTKFKPKVPESAEDFMLLLKRFANLLFALFSKDCPYYKCLVMIIKALKTFSKNARENMSMKSKASILWIILLQGRQFAMGEMEVLAEFTQLHTNLQSKQGVIVHAELPKDLIESKDIKKRVRDDEVDAVVKKTKHTSTTGSSNSNNTVSPNPNNWHPTLKAKLAEPLAKAGYPSFSKIIKFCGTDPEKVYARDGHICAPNAFFGRCFKKEHCTKKHKHATDAEVEKILPLLTKFIATPLGITQGQS